MVAFQIVCVGFTESKQNTETDFSLFFLCLSQVSVASHPFVLYWISIDSECFFFFFSGHVFSFKSSGGTIYLLVHFVLRAKQCQFHRTDVKKMVFSDMRLLNFSTLAAVLSQTTQRYHHPLWHHKGLIPRTMFTMQCQWEEMDIVSKEWKNEFSSNIGALGLNLQKQCKGCRPSNCFSFSKSNVRSFILFYFFQL